MCVGYNGVIPRKIRKEKNYRWKMRKTDERKKKRKRERKGKTSRTLKNYSVTMKILNTVS